MQTEPFCSRYQPVNVPGSERMPATLPALVQDVLAGRRRWPQAGTDEQIVCLAHGVTATVGQKPELVGSPDIPRDLMLQRPSPGRPHLVGSRAWCTLLGHPVVQGVGRWVSAHGLGAGEEAATKKAVSLLPVLAAEDITPSALRLRVYRTARQTKPLRQDLSREQPVDPTSWHGQAVLAGATTSSSTLAPTDPPAVAAYLYEALAGWFGSGCLTPALGELIDHDAEIAATESLRVAVDSGLSGEELLAALRSSGPTKSRRLAQHLTEPRLAAVLVGVSSIGASALLWHFVCHTPPSKIPRPALAGWRRVVGEIAGWPPPPPDFVAAFPAATWAEDLAVSA